MRLQNAGEAAEIRDKSHAELDAARKRAEEAETRLAAVEQQQQQAVEASRQEQQQRISELESANQQLGADLQQLRESDERRSKQSEELDAVRKRAEEAEARIVVVEQQQQQAIETSRQEQQHRISELESANQQLGVDLQQMRENDEKRSKQADELDAARKRAEEAENKHQQQHHRVSELECANQKLEAELRQVRETDERRSTQIKELKESSRRIREEMEQQKAAAVTLNSKDSSESNGYEIVDKNSASDAHNGASGTANGDVSTVIVTKRVTTVTTEHHDIPLSSNNEQENLVEVIDKVDVPEPNHS